MDLSFGLTRAGPVDADDPDTAIGPAAGPQAVLNESIATGSLSLMLERKIAPSPSGLPERDAENLSTMRPRADCGRLERTQATHSSGIQNRPSLEHSMQHNLGDERQAYLPIFLDRHRVPASEVAME